LNFKRLKAKAEAAPITTDNTATVPAITREFLIQVKYGIAGSLKSLEKLVKEPEVGIKEVTCKLPVGFMEEMITRYIGKSAKNDADTATRCLHRLSLNHLLMRNYPIP
jgi:hypothetical protein